MELLDKLAKYCTYTSSNEEIIFKPINDTLEHINILLQHISKNSDIIIENDKSIRIKTPLNKKYRKVYTTGCYDIIHYGHLNIFKKSKELCDYLIVGVSTDELILSEKGRKPVIPFEERIKMVEAIKYVDKVIPQVDKNKQKIIDLYEIDAISVGDDWKDKYPKVSCSMIYIPYSKNVSSTILKNTLNLNNKD